MNEIKTENNEVDNYFFMVMGVILVLAVAYLAFGHYILPTNNLKEGWECSEWYVRTPNFSGYHLKSNQIAGINHLCENHNVYLQIKLNSSYVNCSIYNLNETTMAYRTNTDWENTTIFINREKDCVKWSMVKKVIN